MSIKVIVKKRNSKPLLQ